MIGQEITKEIFEDFLTKFIQEDKCSDIHFSPGNKISIRAAGKILKKEPHGISLLTDKSTVSIFELGLSYLSQRAKDHVNTELEEFSHSGFAISVKGLRFRVNVSRIRGGYYIVMRTINAIPPKIETLNFSEKTEEALKYVAERKEGLFFVVGPTGSGKTTTLASLINYINLNFQKNIITLEDPVEFEHIPQQCHVIQRELGRDFPFFRSGLKSAMREDPDIILVGEVRDEESLELALDASETGHLVFATLHTDSAIATIQRIISMAHNPSLTRDRLKSCLIGAIAQKLLPITKKDDEGNMVNSRLLLWEIMVVNKAISNLIKEGHDVQIGGALDNSPHSQSFNKTLFDYVNSKAIDMDYALKNSPDKKSLASMLTV